MKDCDGLSAEKPDHPSRRAAGIEFRQRHQDEAREAPAEPAMANWENDACVLLIGFSLAQEFVGSQ